MDIDRITNMALDMALKDLGEKYVGFKKLKKKIKGARDPAAVAAAVGRKKYGKDKFQKFAAKGKKMRGVAPLKRTKKKVKLRRRGD